MSVTLETSLNSLEISWLERVEDRPTLYSSPEYINLVSQVTCSSVHYLVSKVGTEVKGYLPFLSRSANGIKAMNALPFFSGHGGPVLKENDPKIETDLIRAWVEESEKSQYSTLITHVDQGGEEYEKLIQPTGMDYRIGQYCLFEGFTSGDVMDSFHHKTRNMVRKGVKSGVEVCRVEGDDLAWNFLEIQQREAMESKGANSKPSAFFQALRASSSTLKPCLYGAYLNGVLIAALLTIRHGLSEEYFTPVIDPEYRSLQPLSVIIANAMQCSLDEGVKLWNFGGTHPSLNDLRRFKNRWGAKEANYYYYSVTRDIDLQHPNKVRSLSQHFPYFYLHPLES